MVKRIGSMNPETITLVKELRKLSVKENVNIWKTVAKWLEKPSRQRPAVNLGKLERFYNEKLDFVVPGKVLGDGTVTKPVNVSALNSSVIVVDRLKSVKGSFMTISELMKKNPKGKNLKIIV
ncbi:MAG: 50S ribosomal protein L18e [archaeon]|nr:50S ribosomal protein L18e [archaeon]